jgi:hypothetical protein
MKTRTKFILSLTAILILTAGRSFGKYSGGTGEPNDPYQIADVNDLLVLAADTNDYGKCFVLTADINLTGLTFTQAPIAPDTDSSTNLFQGATFTGIFDGNGHTISNLIITTSMQDYIGLFGFVDIGGEIKNLGVENVNVTGRDFVGGLTGYEFGQLTSCYATGSVSGNFAIGGLVGWGYVSWLTSCYANCSVTGGSSIGGMVGYCGASLTSCYATGSVTGEYDNVGGLVGFFPYGTVQSCYATGSVSGPYDIGGLVGWGGGNITSCYAAGSVSGYYNAGGLVGHMLDYSSISNCYATGSVNGTTNVGGMVGYGPSGRVSNSFWDTQTSGQTTSSGGTGMTTSQMKTLSTFTSAGWDFASVWAMPLGQYPVLFLRQMGDLNSDGVVDFKDFAIFAAKWLSGE